MLALVQRTLGQARLVYDSYDRSFDGPGLVVLLGWEKSDEARAALAPNASTSLAFAEQWILSRVQGLRVFPDEQGRMNLNLADFAQKNSHSHAGILWVPQFTLAAKLESGFRPSFTDAMSPDIARSRFESFVSKCGSSPGAGYENFFGSFGADMNLSFTNWGPVTIPLKA